jgi:RNA exonuclease 4
MGKPFFTKKEKAKMRERRKKQRKATHNEDDKTEKNSLEQRSTEEETKKRSRSEEDNKEKWAFPAEKKQNSIKITTKIVQGKLHVLVPSSLSSKDAKKFRKDARRSLKKEGKGDENIEFVVSHDISHSSYQKKKKKFPSIKELLEEKRVAEKEEKEKQKQQKQLDDIPDAIKTQYIAMDCEMVGIGTDGKKSALARVSLVDWHGNTVLDTFVKVPIRVTDFRTHVSGVEPKHLKEKSAMEVDQCRVLVASLLKSKILVGHALSNDLKALMLLHPKSMIRDTSKYRPFQAYRNGKWRPRKLRDLAIENLSGKEGFQSGEHDSVEDAKTTLELFQLVQKQWEKEVANKK